MIEYQTLDLTTVQAGIVVHGVNCQGKMGSGVALAIRNRWPGVYKAYRSEFEKRGKNNASLLGFVQFVNTGEGVKAFGLELYVANLFSQLYYGRDGAKYANPEAISQGLATVAEFARTRKLPVYMPKIGCNLGGLNWETEVKSVVESIANLYQDITFIICDYKG